MDLRIADGVVLVGGELMDATLHVSAGDGLITEIGSDRSASIQSMLKISLCFLVSWTSMVTHSNAR